MGKNVIIKNVHIENDEEMVDIRIEDGLIKEMDQTYQMKVMKRWTVKAAWPCRRSSNHTFTWTPR